MITKAEGRAHCEKLFFDAVNKLPITQGKLEEARDEVSAVKEAIDGYRRGFSRKSRLGQLWGNTLNTLGIAPIVPVTIRSELTKAIKRRDFLSAEIIYLRGSLEHYGKKLPGTHDFLGLNYNPFEPPQIPYHVNFGVKTQPEQKVWEVFISGEFRELLYQTIPEEKPKLRIPHPDSEAPILLLPEGFIMKIKCIGYSGIGSYDRYSELSQWKPRSTSKAKPINPQEFTWLSRS